MDIMRARELSMTVNLNFFIKTICQILRRTGNIAWHSYHRHDITFQALIMVQLS